MDSNGGTAVPRGGGGPALPLYVLRSGRRVRCLAELKDKCLPGVGTYGNF